MEEVNKAPEKVSDFIDRHTNDKNQINVVGAMMELYVHIRTVKEALGDFGQWAIQMEERVNTLEGKKKIEVISPDQAKGIIGPASRNNI